MRFAHLADCHIGGWREQKISELGLRAFIESLNICIKKGVDFVLISGDLFNTALPPIDCLKAVVKKLKELNERGISVYVIAGSHDFSPSGKTIIDVLEHAGLAVNVTKGIVEDGKLKLKFTIDKKTGAKITGILGRKGMLDKRYYDDLDRQSLENEDGFKIFMFHGALDELKPAELQEMNSFPLSLLPKNFKYYAGGHVHSRIKKEEIGYGIIAYPGALFPNNFYELERFSTGGFYFYENENIEWIPVNVCNTYSIRIDCNLKSAKEIEEELKKEINRKEFINTIVTIRLFGKLRESKINDIDFKRIFELVYEKGAIFVMRNVSQLSSPDFEGIRVEGTQEEIEEKVISENLKDANFDRRFIVSLIAALNKEKQDGETNIVFEKRIIEEAFKAIGIEGIEDERNAD